MPNPYSQTWRWDVMRMLGATPGDSPPNPAQPNQLWWESDTGALFVYYVDADSAQWVQISNVSPTLYDPYRFGLADMRLSSKSATQVVMNNKADGTGTDTAAFFNNGDFVAAGAVYANSTFVAASTNAVLAATGAGTVRLRPNGAASATGETTVSTGGTLNCASFSTSGTHTIFQALGTLGQATGGSAMIQQANGYHAFLTFHISSQFACNFGMNSAGNFYMGGWSFGANTYQQWSSRDFANPACDYRIKEDVTPLPSMWEKVKALKPVSYRIKEFTLPAPFGRKAEGPVEPNVYADDREHWGMIAHEVQETLLPTASHGVKDDPDLIQTPTALPIITALTKALQEAMARIEALEAAR